MYYCGVCKSIGRNFGQLSRFGLVYETAVLAMLLDLVCTKVTTPDIIGKSCIAHPLKKAKAVENSECVDYAAAVNVFLFYFKLQDSWQDDKNFLSAAGQRALKRGFKKAAKQYPMVADFVYFSLRELAKLEKINCKSIDEACEPFAKMMSYIFKWPDSDIFVNNPVKFYLLGKIGYNVGKWIYLIDAVCDIEDDRKSKNYNVLIKSQNENSGVITEDVKTVLNLCLANCAEAYQELLTIVEKEIDTDNLHFINAKGVIDNLFYIGMRNITEKKAGKMHESL
ncbi:MAG: hypothetical protein E7387_00145 [Ruminococcaceae bacterium]|nr:hypothetical protein [Oscillospiraceae bacterium]